MADTLDQTDMQILKTLQKNSKLATKEQADAVHLTPTPVMSLIIINHQHIKSLFFRLIFCFIPNNYLYLRIKPIKL